MKVPLKYSATNFLLLALSWMLETPIIVIYPFYVEIVLFVNFVHVIILNGILKTWMTWPYCAFQIGHIAFDNWDPYRGRRDQEWHWNYRENQVGLGWGAGCGCILCHSSMFSGVEHCSNWTSHPYSICIHMAWEYSLLLWFVALIVIVDLFTDLTLDHCFLLIQILYEVTVFPLGGRSIFTF